MRMRGSSRERYGITRRDSVDELYPRMRDAHDYFERARDPAPKKKDPTEILRPLLGAGAGAAAAGLLTGRLNHWNFPGTPIPIGLTLAVAGQAIEYFNLAGRFSEDFGNAGIGAFASWLNMLATGWGQQMRARSGGELGPITAGIAGSPSGDAFGCCAGVSQPQALPTAYASAPHAQLPQPAFLRPLTEAEVAALSHTMRAA